MSAMLHLGRTKGNAAATWNEPPARDIEAAAGTEIVALFSDEWKLKVHTHARET